jgi:dTDP-4-amino-4,6-dideoxygalactose transaminase
MPKLARLALNGGKPVRARKNFLVFGAPPLGEEEIAGVTDSLRRRWIGTGPKVAEFERAFASYKSTNEETPNAVAVNSCTAALHLSILSLGIGPGDEVITTPMTFCATANAILHAGAKPVLADVDPVTFNIDPEKIAQKITKKTKAILPVHFAGRACDMNAITALARKHRLKVIEDCAHAIETEWRGPKGMVKAGTAGDAGCFSFYATKNVTTGEGGLVLTSNMAIADRVKRLALHGMSKDAWKRYSDSGYVHYDVVELGYKYNMTDLQAAIGLPQLRKVEAHWKRRRTIWARYQEAFADLSDDGVTLPAEPGKDERHAYHLYTPLVRKEAQVPGRTVSQKRDFVLTALTAEGIGAGVHYRALVDHPYYRKALGWKRADCPVAADIGDRTLSLPLSPALTDKDVDDVITAFRKILGT